MIPVRKTAKTRLWSALFLGTLVVSCSPGEPEEFRIGLLAIRDARYWEASGAPSIRGAELAARQINEAGGLSIHGRPHLIRIIVREYAARADDAATQARGLLNQDSVHALVGPQLSAHAIPVSVIAEAAAVPMISPMSTNAETTRGKRFVFRLASLDDVQAAVMARYAVEELGLATAAVLYDEAAAYSRDLAARFQQAFENAGGAMVARERYTTDRATDFTEQLRRIAAADPEALYLPNPATDGSLQARQARELGIEAQFLGSDAWDLFHMAEMPGVEGTVITHQWHYDIPDSEVGEFIQAFQVAYQKIPRTTAAMTYDAVKILAHAAGQCGSLDPEEIRGRISALNDFRGATGTISFRGGGNPDRSIAISTIRAGAVVVLGTIDP